MTKKEKIEGLALDINQMIKSQLPKSCACDSGSIKKIAGKISSKIDSVNPYKFKFKCLEDYDGLGLKK